MATAPELRDREEIFRAMREKRRPDPEVVRRVQSRGQEIRNELRRRGATDVAVALIRGARDE